MPSITRPTVTLHYEEAGAGPPIVFLHGWCDGSASWAATMSAFAEDFHCIAPDMRGHGQSEMPRDHCYTAEALTNDIIAICSEADIESPVIIGHSYGGYLAGELARRFPGFARAIVIEDQALDLSAFATQMRSVEFLIRSPETHMEFRTQLFETMIRPEMPPGDRAMLAKMTEETPVEVGQALWTALFEFTEDEIAKRSEELMAALGNQPSLTIEASPMPEHHAELERCAPGVHTAVIESGHWIHLEHPAEFQACVAEFVAGL
jgi:pimeloyl-ACP methyl ester carboxylesterase